jgi:hypothetical protein
MATTIVLPGVDVVGADAHSRCLQAALRAYLAAAIRALARPDNEPFVSDVEVGCLVGGHFVR